MTDTDSSTTLANDNRSLSSFLKPHNAKRARAMIADVVFFLEDEGIPDHILADTLFMALNATLQPPEDPTPQSMGTYYSQLRRMAGVLQERLQIVEDLCAEDNAS